MRSIPPGGAIPRVARNGGLFFLVLGFLLKASCSSPPNGGGVGSPVWGRGGVPRLGEGSVAKVRAGFARVAPVAGRPPCGRGRPWSARACPRAAPSRGRPGSGGPDERHRPSCGTRPRACRSTERHCHHGRRDATTSRTRRRSPCDQRSWRATRGGSAQRRRAAGACQLGEASWLAVAWCAVGAEPAGIGSWDPGG